MEQKHDIFISYRRKDRFDRTTGTSYARNILLTLESNGYKGRVFFDHNDMEPGDFEKIILSAIRSAKIFILVLTKDSMLRCGNEDDWVRKEILEAKQCKLKILILNMDDEFKDSDYPADFPKELEDPVKKQHHLVIYTSDSYEREMKHIIDTYISPIVPPSHIVLKQKTDDTDGKENHGAKIEKQKGESLLKRIRKLFCVEPTPIEVYEDDQFRYKIGDYYEDNEKSGIVVSVTKDGRHGIIISLEEQETPWCSYEEAERTKGVSTRATSREDGLYNTLQIMNIVDWETHYHAFKDTGSKDGAVWYVPSIEELAYLTDKKTLDAVNSGLISRRAEPIFAFASGCREKTYWSSTETPERDTVFTLCFNEDKPRWEDTDYNVFPSLYGSMPKYAPAYVRTFAKF